MAVTEEDHGHPIFAAQGDAVTGRKVVTHFHWYGATTAGHTCVIQDVNGNQICKMVAYGANWDELYPLFGAQQHVDGITVSTLASGTVQAHYA